MLSDIRQQIVNEANAWVGTPYAHFQQCKGAGVDCIQLTIGVGKAVGFFENLEVPYYTEQWHLHKKEEVLLNNVLMSGCTEKPIKDALPGDFFLFRFNEESPCSHAGIYVMNNDVVHALKKYGRVLRHQFNHKWKSLWVAYCFNYPGVE